MNSILRHVCPVFQVKPKVVAKSKAAKKKEESSDDDSSSEDESSDEAEVSMHLYTTGCSGALHAQHTLEAHAERTLVRQQQRALRTQQTHLCDKNISR